MSQYTHLIRPRSTKCVYVCERDGWGVYGCSYKPIKTINTEVIPLEQQRFVNHYLLHTNVTPYTHSEQNKLLIM